MCNIFRQITDMFLSPSQQGTYQVAKWNGTKVSVKILDKESYSDPESMYVSHPPTPIFCPIICVFNN